MILHVLCLSFAILSLDSHEQWLTLCLCEQTNLYWILSKCCLALQGLGTCCQACRQCISYMHYDRVTAGCLILASEQQPIKC